jgi:hypothetical protein
MTEPISPNIEELKRAYQLPNPGRAGSQQAEAVLTGTEGITVLCSANTTGEGDHSSLIRLTMDGAIQWKRDYDLNQGAGHAITKIQGGGFAIAGDVRHSAMEYQGHLIHTDISGEIVAEGIFGPRGVTGFVAIATLSDGSTLAGGTARWKGWLMCANAGLGTEWDLLIDKVDDVRGIASLPDGGFAAVASTDRSTTGLGLTRLAAFAEDGSIRWQVQLPLSGHGELTAITALPDGGLAGVGHHTTTEDGSAQVWVARFDAAGGVVWECRVGVVGEEHRGRAIMSLSDGSLVIASDEIRSGQREARVTHFSADGTIIAGQTYGGERIHNLARDLARTEDDGLVLVGAARRELGKNSIWILCLAPDGQTLWEHVIESAQE